MAFYEQDFGPEILNDPECWPHVLNPNNVIFLEIIFSIRFIQTLFQFYLFSCSSPNPPQK